ncbi:nitric oxide-associated protein 1 [Athalia rosae]|uniref:nitric oxide-associated protein 1 n=1 Tax=Athalia rosae TaxID=37344 RepID=UPI00203330C0|nr:nitric oxide-associated protein 1 [Athalia rosae]
MLSTKIFLRYSMRYLHHSQSRTIVQDCFRLCHNKYNNRFSRAFRTSSLSAFTLEVEKEEKDSIDPVLQELRDKLIYCEYLDSDRLKKGYLRNKIADDIKVKKSQKLDYERQLAPVYSLVIENMLKDKNRKSSENLAESSEGNIVSKPIHMPYSGIHKYETVETDLIENDSSESFDKVDSELNEDYKFLYEKYLQSSAGKSNNSEERHYTLTEALESQSDYSQTVDDLSKIPPDWMTDYEQYDDSAIDQNWQLNYGTPNPNSEVSVVPCGGCGALLHCKDPAIPGYLPSEIFSGKRNSELHSIKCQRCHFLSEYNTSLAVHVSPEDYPKLLSTMRNKKAAVILLVDLTDFPCSIWPGILDVIGTERPVFVVGNKVDLLLPDSADFHQHVTECIRNAIVQSGVNQANIKYVTLISAKTGHGMEHLINKLYEIWQYRGHVYLVGCTNSGKSTLFNALLQSDYCRSAAADIIQRATTSPWPGTTLNLLKFPIMRPSPWRLALRAKRLRYQAPLIDMREQERNEELNRTKDLRYAQLIGHLDRTFSTQEPLDEESGDIFLAPKGKNPHKQTSIDLNDPAYVNARWCYDTPGTVQPDQVLHLLTTDELMLTLPKMMIIPRTFIIRPSQTLFLGGLGRLDYLDGYRYIRVTVFASHKLPVTICYTEDAGFIYDRMLTTGAFAVPLNNPERLKRWPRLSSKDFEITGVGWKVSAADIVLSSAGWVAITPGPESKATFRAWTPQGRGLHLRNPALLRYSVGMCGPRIKDTPVYWRGMPVYRKP